MVSNSCWEHKDLETYGVCCKIHHFRGFGSQRGRWKPFAYLVYFSLMSMGLSRSRNYFVILIDKVVVMEVNGQHFINGLNDWESVEEKKFEGSSSFMEVQDLINDHVNILGKRKREEEREKGIEGNDSECNSFQPPDKRQRDDIIGRILTYKDSPFSLYQTKRCRNLINKFQELIELVNEEQKFHSIHIIEEVRKEWGELGEDPDAWETKIFKEGLDLQLGISSQAKISKQFKQIIHSGHCREHFRQLQIICGIFIRHTDDPALEPKSRKRIFDYVPIFENVVTLSIRGEIVRIPKSYLIRCDSPYFNGLLNNDMISNVGILETLELNIDEKNYQILDRWLRNPSGESLRQLGVTEILDFLVAVCPYDIPLLFRHCEEAIRRQINNENLYFLLEHIYQFLKENKRNGINFSFPLIEETLILFLVTRGIYIDISPSSSPKNPHWFLGAETEIDVVIMNRKGAIEVCLQSPSIFEDVLSIVLDISSLDCFSEEEIKGFVSSFPNTKTINICYLIVDNGEDSKPTPLRDWSFLKEFKKLKEVVIKLVDSLNDDFFECFDEFPNGEEDDWLITFDTSQITCFADHYIKLKLLESYTTTCHQWPEEVKSKIRDEHIRQLLDYSQLDLKSDLLDLREMTLSFDTIQQILLNMEQLEILKFNRSYPELPRIVQSLPQNARGLKKLLLPLSFFNLDGSLEAYNHFLKGGCKRLNLLYDLNTPINPQFIEFLRQSPSLNVNLQFNSHKCKLFNNSFEIKLKEENHQINEDAESRKHLTILSQLLQSFGGLPIALDVREIPHLFPDFLIGLSQSFPFVSELRVETHFDLPSLKGFSQLRILRFPSLKFIEELSPPQLENLQNYPVDIVVENQGDDAILWENLIRKLIAIQDLLPNFQGLRCLTKEQRASLTDRELRALLPRKCYSVLELSGMDQISAQVIVDILSDFPHYHSLLRIAHCQRIQKEILEGKLPIDDFIQLITLPDQDYGYVLFRDSKNQHYIKQLTDQHIDKLLIARKIPNDLNLTAMSSIGKATFLRLLREVKPVSLIMENTPDLFTALPLGASHIKANLVLPFVVIKEKGYLKSVLENFLEKGVRKCLIIKCMSSDLECLDELLIGEISHDNLNVMSFSPEIDFHPLSHRLVFKDCEANRTLSIGSPYFDLLNKFTSRFSIVSVIVKLSSLDQTNSLASIIQLFSNAENFNLKIFFNEEMLKDPRHFEPLIHANINYLTLYGDEKLLPESPALPLLQKLPFNITVLNVDWDQIKDLETYVKKLEFLKILFPHHNSLSLIPMSEEIRNRLTDEILLRNKPISKSHEWSFNNMSSLSLEGIIKYLEGNPVKIVTLRGCHKALSEGAVEALKRIYPEAKIIL